MEKIGLVTITYNSAHVLRGFLDSVLKPNLLQFTSSSYLEKDETFNISELIEITK